MDNRDLFGAGQQALDSSLSFNTATNTHTSDMSAVQSRAAIFRQILRKKLKPESANPPTPSVVSKIIIKKRRQHSAILHHIMFLIFVSFCGFFFLDRKSVARSFAARVHVCDLCGFGSGCE